ncbi:MAG: CPBP family intramembrane glutamic endopeptidase [bacterium]
MDVVTAVICAVMIDLTVNFSMRALLVQLDFLPTNGKTKLADLALLTTWVRIIIEDPLMEEILFRGPLAAVAYKYKQFERVIAWTLISSILFGLAHGGPANILMQGLGGITYSVVFLKSGGLHGNPLKGLLASSSCHALFNLIVGTMAVLGQRPH